MRGSRIRGLVAGVIGGSILCGSVPLLTPPVARADIYQMRDRYGTMHFTNVPTDSRWKLVIREPQIRRWPGIAVSSSARIDPSTYDPIIADVARRFRVEQALVKAVIKAESGFQTNAVSPKGARGLMQLMPATAELHGVRNVHEPYENIVGGVQHLRMLLDRYAGNVVLALAAYNAGAAWVDEHGSVPPIPETVTYVQRVLEFRQNFLQQQIASVR